MLNINILKETTIELPQLGTFISLCKILYTKRPTATPHFLDFLIALYWEMALDRSIFFYFLHHCDYKKKCIHQNHENLLKSSIFLPKLIFDVINIYQFLTKIYNIFLVLFSTIFWIPYSGYCNLCISKSPFSIHFFNTSKLIKLHIQLLKTRYNTQH